MAKGKQTMGGAFYGSLIIAVLLALTILAGLAPVLSINVTNTLGVVTTYKTSLFDVLFNGSLDSVTWKAVFTLFLPSSLDVGTTTSLLQASLWIGFIIAALGIIVAVAKMFLPKVQKPLNYVMLAVSILGIVALLVAFIIYIVLAANVTEITPGISVSLATIAIPLMLAGFILAILMCVFQNKIFRK